MRYLFAPVRLVAGLLYVAFASVVWIFAPDFVDWRGTVGVTWKWVMTGGVE